MITRAVLEQSTPYSKALLGGTKFVKVYHLSKTLPHFGIFSQWGSYVRLSYFSTLRETTPINVHKKDFTENPDLKKEVEIGPKPGTKPDSTITPLHAYSPLRPWVKGNFVGQP